MRVSNRIFNVLSFYKFLSVCFFITVLFFSQNTFCQINFTNISGLGADESNIPYNKDGGCSFADYDLDGDLDLVVNTSDNNTTRRSYLLRNAIAPGLKTDGLTERTAAWGDCNNDGYPDLIVNSFGRFKVLLNNAGTSFTILTNVTSMIDGINSEGAGWLDFDNDGDLDYFVENDGNGIDMFENDGSTPTPIFTQVTVDATGGAGTGSGGLGLPEGGSSDGDYATSVDLNADGYSDIIARRRNNGTNDGLDNNPYDIFINNGDGTFAPITTFNERGNNSDKGGILTGDFDNDGDFDLLWTSGTMDAGRVTVYENSGTNSMNFIMVPNPFTLDNGVAFTQTNTEGASMGDVDLDGDLDVFITNTGGGANHLFLNNSLGSGNFAFRQPGPSWIPGAAINYGIDINANGQGCVLADYDNDGDVDLYVNRNGSANQLWQNDYIGSTTEASATYKNNYIRIIPKINLGGGVSRPAVNSNVRFLDCDGNPIGGIRSIGSGGAGHGSQSSPWLIFGLPDGPDESYFVEVQYTRNGTTPVVVRKTVVPSLLPNINLGSSSLTLEQTLIILDTDSDDLSSCVDTDGDGVYDPIDLDDDNDGIPDLLECEEDFASKNLLSNGVFNENYVDSRNPGTAYASADNGFAPNPWERYETSDLSTETVISFSVNYQNRVDLSGFNLSPSGGSFMGFRRDEGIYSDIYIEDPNEELTILFEYTEYTSTTLSPGDVNLTLRFGGITSSDGTEISIIENFTSSGTPDGTWEKRQIRFTPSSLGLNISGITTFFIGATNSAVGTWGFIDNLLIIKSQDLEGGCDYDNDGIPNSLDLDSDNDGIFDVIEAGLSNLDTDIDGQIDGPNSSFGNNGLFNGIETSPESGVINFTITDSDGDGNIDAVDLDSDGDGCNDVLEAGFTDDNFDGTIGILPVTVDSQGLVTSGTDGYTGTSSLVTDSALQSGCSDNDNDGISDINDLDDDNDGILDSDEIQCATLYSEQVHWFHDISNEGTITDVTRVSSVSSEVLGLGLSGTYPGTGLTLTEIDAFTLQQAMNLEEYVEYEFTTSSTFSNEAILSILGNNRHSIGYDYSVFMSSNDFISQTLLFSTTAPVSAAGWHEINLENHYIQIEKNTSYKF